VALVIEVENPATKRYDRLLKPSLYAEAGISSYWRIDPAHSDPRVTTYALTTGTYKQDHKIAGHDLVKIDSPYPVRLAPSTWV